MDYSRLSLGFAVVILTTLVCSTEARPPRTVVVGGRGGWRWLPNDGLNHWAEKKRFRINDTIVFEYEKGKDSVLVVRKTQYYNCNKTSPIHNLTDGNSRFKFTRNGPYYFISGYGNNCINGQKLHLVVMSPNHNKTIPTPSPTPTPIPIPYTPAPIPIPYTPSPYSPAPIPIPYTPSPQTPSSYTPSPYTPSPIPSPYTPSPNPSPYTPSPTPSSPLSPSPSSDEGWVSPAPKKNSGLTLSVISSLSFGVVAGIIVCMV